MSTSSGSPDEKKPMNYVIFHSSGIQVPNCHFRLAQKPLVAVLTQYWHAFDLRKLQSNFCSFGIKSILEPKSSRCEPAPPGCSSDVVVPRVDVVVPRVEKISQPLPPQRQLDTSPNTLDESKLGYLTDSESMCQLPTSLDETVSKVARPNLT